MVPPLRRTTRSTAGCQPNRLGNWVSTESRKLSKSTTELPVLKTVDLSKQDEEPTTEQVSSSASHANSKSNTFSVKPSSKSSYRTSASTIRRMQLEAELDTQAALHKLAEEEASANLAQLEIKNKLEKIRREKELMRKKFELENAKLDEEPESDDSQWLSEDSEIDGDNEEEVFSQRPTVPNPKYVNSANVGSYPDLSSRFQEFSKCIVNAIVSAGTSQHKNIDPMKHFIARQGGAKELPLFFGEAEEWPSFIAAFNRSTASCQFSNDENLIRLQKCLRGKAKENVQGLLITPENVPQILRVLERRFGQPAHIIDNMMSKVRSLQVHDNKPEQLLDLATSVANFVGTVESMKKPQHLLNPVLLQEVVAKLPFHLNLRWGEKLSEPHSTCVEPNLKVFSEWLTKICDAMSLTGFRIKQRESDGKAKVNKKELVHATTVNPAKYPCPCCTQTSHRLDSCPKFGKANIEDRWKFVKEKKVCISCLRIGHAIKTCKFRKDCGVNSCKRPHHKLLHDEEKKKTTEVDKLAEEVDLPSNEVTAMTVHVKPNPRVLLKVLPVTLAGPNVNLDTFALIDDGATATLLNSSIADKPGLDGPEDPLEIRGTSPILHVDSTPRSVSLKISGRNDPEEYTLQNVRTVKNLKLPSQSVNINKLRRKWSYLPELNLDCLTDAKPMILLGLDNANLILNRETVEGPSQGPIASRTLLGWVIQGNNGTVKSRVDPESVLVAYITEADEILQNLVKEQYSLESIGIKLCSDKVRNRSHERAEEIMNATTKRIGNRFETGLLWKDDEVRLPESKQNAFKKLRAIERKMDTDPVFSDRYTEKMQDYINKGYAVKLSLKEINESDNKINYLSHFDVTNPNKPGKLRIVLNAAAKNQGTSLNDHLLPGPDLYTSLPGILFKFRQGRIAVAADIKEMFPQIKIRHEDSKAQRFLWRGNDRNREPDVYEMTSLIFGSICSPASAQFVKNKNAEEFRIKFPDAYKAIVQHHYVDDYVDSHNSEEEASRISAEIIKIHSYGGFHICNWVSNSRMVLNTIPESMRATDLQDINVVDLPEERILGIRWKPSDDIFRFTFMFHKVSTEVLEKSRSPTKREVYSLISSIFDPLGFLSHFTIQAKILQQDIWRTGGEWDKPIPSDIRAKWELWLNGLREL